MAFVETTLGDRTYRIDCAEAQYERLTRLTQVVEARAAALDQSGAAAAAPEGEDPELRFLLLTSLLVADLLLKAEDALESAQSEGPTIEQAPLIAATSEPIEEAQIVAQESAKEATAPQGEDRPELAPDIEAALAELFESAAARMNAASEALERI